MKAKLEKKITYHRLELNNKIENKSKFYKRVKNKKYRVKVEILINKRTTL